MSETQNKAKLRNAENRVTNRYLFITKFFLFISLILIICVIVVFAGVSVFNYGHNWAGVGLEGWVIAACVMFGLFIIFELFFYSHFSSVKDKIKELETPKPEFIQGKRVYVYTHPKGKEGGIFSKTFVEIDDGTILRLRSLMIPPEDLW